MNEFPIHEVRGGFREALARGPVVLTAPTASGKSTIVPVWCADEAGAVLVVEPRRVACRSLARFVAKQEGTGLGEGVGYAVRHDERVGRGTRVAFVTPGIALRMLEGGRHRRFPVVILDEFHERSLELDLLLALLTADPETKLVVMSATLDAPRLAAFLGGTHVAAEGRQHPVTMENEAEPLLPSGRGLAARVGRAVERMLDREGDLLVFLPGKGEIADCEAALSGRRDLEVLPLHARLRPAEQDRAFEPGSRRRVVLATNVAETSVTLPRIGVVIDSGLVRQTRYRGSRGYLTLASIAMDAAEQRAGRAGRLFPGHCLRLWSPEAVLEPVTAPEIHREALATVVLAAAACGRRIGEMRFLDPPREHAVDAAERELRHLGALDGERRLSGLGERMFGLPVDPLMARVLLEAEGTPAVQDVVDLVAAVGCGHPLFTGGPRPSDPEDDLRAGGCDATALIAALRRGEPRRHRLRAPSLSEARAIARQLRRRLGIGEPARDARVERERLARTVLRADPRTGHVPRQRKRETVWANGHGELELGKQSAVPEDSKALVVVDTVALTVRRRKTVQVITCAIPCTAATLRAAGLGQVRVARAKVRKGRIVAEQIRSHAGLVLEKVESVPEGEAAREAVVQLLLSGGLFREVGEVNRERMAAHQLSRRLGGEGEPADLESWLRARVDDLGLESGADLPLLLPDDLTFPDLPPERRIWLDDHYPREVSVGDARYAVTYDTRAMEVALERCAGTRTQPPSPAYLPAWPGWRVIHRDRSRVTVLRERR